MKRLAAGGAAATALLCGGWGCNLILDSSKYHCVSSGDDAGSADATHAPAFPDDGATPVGACAAGQDRRGLQNACTDAACVPYTGSLPSCEGGLCPLPAVGLAADSGAGIDTGNDAGTNTPCASAQPDPSGIIFVTGSTALRGFIQEVSRALAIQPTNRVTIVYQGSGSCFGVKAAIDPGNNLMVPSAGATTYYDAAGNQKTCSLDPNGVVADLGASDVFYSTCYLGEPVTPALPQNIADNFGPVQIMNFAVPQGSSQYSISLGAAYYVFGFGGAPYAVPPWTDPTQLQIRSSASGTQSMIAAAIGVPATQWHGVENATSAALGNALVAAGKSVNPITVDAALGILASDYLTQNTQALRGLALQDENASCAYYPNSTATAHDNANTRDGHYPLWGPSHFYARINGGTQLPFKAGVTAFVDGVSGVTPVPGLDLIAEYASKGLVPLCAMHVSRTSDGAAYQPYQAPTTCNCYFDLIATGSTACAPCNTSADCLARTPSCNKFGPPPQQGYCDL